MRLRLATFAVNSEVPATTQVLLNHSAEFQHPLGSGWLATITRCRYALFEALMGIICINEEQ